MLGSQFAARTSVTENLAELERLVNFSRDDLFAICVVWHTLEKMSNELRDRCRKRPATATGALRFSPTVRLPSGAALQRAQTRCSSLAFILNAHFSKLFA